MKKLVLASAFILWPVFAIAQSNLYFPRSFTQVDRQSTGFAIVNPGAGDAGVTFTLNSADGSTLAAASRTIPQRGQFAQLGSELFPTATASGWVQVTSLATGLQGFWIGGEFVFLTRGDGAVSAPLATDQVYPLVPVGTELNIANPNTFSISVTIRAFNDSGAELGSNARTIAAKGIAQLNPLTIVQQSGNIAYLRITGTTPFVSTMVLRVTTTLDNAVLNGIDASSASPTATTLVFPHFIDGQSGTFTYTSTIGIVNLSTRAITVHFQFYSETGGPPVESETFLSPQSAIKGIGSDFFMYAESGFHNGYVRVTADGPIAGVVDYGSTSGGEAIVPAQLTPQTNLLFAHIADLPPWSTGIAIQNPSNSPAAVEVFAMNSNGTLIGGAANVPTARFTLLAGQKIAKLLSEFIPQTQTRSGDGGFVFIRTTNSVPVHAIQLFFTRDTKILANISAVPLPPGLTFVPPNP